LAVEKRLTSPLLDPTSVEKIAEIDSHVGAAMSGLVADARTLVDHARVEAQNHKFTYNEPLGVEALTQGTKRREKKCLVVVVIVTYQVVAYHVILVLFLSHRVVPKMD
jgi:hypothetical protein